MIPKIIKGESLSKLIWYLFGPGKANEHVNPHVVAGFTDPQVLQPPGRQPGRFDVRPLIAVLEAPVVVAQAAGRPVPTEWVWHCSLSLRPEEGQLTDQQWQDIAATFVAGMDFDGCAWVAVRHGLSAGGGDHIHLVTTRFDRSGRRVSWHNDFTRAQDLARRLEHQFGLEELAVRDGATGRPEVTPAEFAIARRKGRPVPDRVSLRSEVRAAAAAASSEAEFVVALRARGLLVRTRVDVSDPSRVTGYAVAVPDDQVVWYGGSKLDGELSLARLRTRWGGVAGSAEEWARAIDRDPPSTTEAASPSPVPPEAESARVWSGAASRIATAARATNGLGGGHADTRVVAAAAVDMAARLADVAEPGTVGQVSWAVDTLARSAVPPRGVTGAASPGAGAVAGALRTVAVMVGTAGRPAGRDGVVAFLAVIAATARLAEALARLQRANQRAASAGAAMVAYERLGSVVQAAADRGITPPDRLPPQPVPGRVAGTAPGGRVRDPDHGRDQWPQRGRDDRSGDRGE